MEGEGGSEPSCTDGVRNGDETDVDCGGACAVCEFERACLRDSDCGTALCDLGICVPCATDHDCPSATFCDVGVCAPDRCVVACADGDDTCQSLPLACDDGDPCTVDLCDPAVGCVASTTLADGLACDDGVACTAGSFCFEGVCGGGASACRPDAQCLLPSECDVLTGTCAPDEPVVCPPSSNPFCFPRSCNPNTGLCTTTRNTDRNCAIDECAQNAACDDGNLCTIDTCEPDQGLNVCKFTPRTCDDNDPITIDFCLDPRVGCQHRERNPAEFCDDGIACTLDSWDAVALACVHTPIDARCDDNDPITTDRCEPEAGCEDHDPGSGEPCVPEGSGCTNQACPPGLVFSQGACWAVSGWDFENGAIIGTGCDRTCSALGLQVAEATRTVAGSDGTDDACRAVLLALGLRDRPDDVLESTCGAGVGCIGDLNIKGQPFTLLRRCASPITTDDSTASWVRRACTCE